MDVKLLGIFVFTLLVLEQVFCCIDVEDKEWSLVDRYRLECPDDGVIVNLNVTAGLGRCPINKGSVCKGLTPYLIESKHNCYWVGSCDLRIPIWKAIDIIVTSDTPECFGRNPEYLEITDAHCFKESHTRELITIADIVRNKSKSGNTGVCNDKDSKQEGIIRSHSYYPWDYEGIHVFRERQYCYDIFIRLNLESTRLVITVNDFDMSDGDKVTFKARTSGSEQQIYASDVGRSFEYPDEIGSVTISIDVESNSIGGRGFVFCFAYINLLDKTPNACAAVVSKAKMIPVSNFETDSISDDPELSAATTTTTKATPAAQPLTHAAPQTCKDCKKPCKKLAKKERRACNKRCRPLCKKNKKKGNKRKDKKKGRKGKKSKRRAN